MHRSRRLARTAVITTIVLGSTLLTSTASPAFASKRDDGDDPGDGLTAQQSLLWFVAVPLLVIGLVWLLAYMPSIVRGPRTRPGNAWSAGPVWFNGPTETDVDDLVAAATPTAGAGGTSARW